MVLQKLEKKIVEKNKDPQPYALHNTQKLIWEAACT